MWYCVKPWNGEDNCKTWKKEGVGGITCNRTTISKDNESSVKEIVDSMACNLTMLGEINEGDMEEKDTEGSRETDHE